MVCVTGGGGVDGVSGRWHSWWRVGSGVGGGGYVVVAACRVVVHRRASIAHLCGW